MLVYILTGLCTAAMFFCLAFELKACAIVAEIATWAAALAGTWLEKDPEKDITTQIK